MTYEEQIEHVLKHINADIKTLKGRKEKEVALNELEFDAICLLKTILLYRGELWNKRNGEGGIMTDKEKIEKLLKSKDVVAKIQNDGGEDYHYLDEKLLPCPFCGGRAYVCTHADVMFQNFWYSIRCFDCDVDAYCCKTAEESAEKWNKRVVAE